MDIKNLLKKIVKTLILSFFGIYLPYFMVFTWGFIFQPVPNSLVGTGLINYLSIAILIAVGFIFYPPIITAILFIASLIENKIKQEWFIFSFSFYVGVMIIIEVIWLPLYFWYFWGIVLAPLVMVIIFMNEKGEKGSG